ncbi:MAG: Outer rane efflux protein [Pedosphaera sp.]|nr:Outer rane efflux protein [Pedosphaera sp.]
MNRWLVIITSASLGLAGCARFHSHPISPAQTAASLEARRLDNADLRRLLETNLARSFPEWPPKTWDFDMLTLAALYYHPSLDIARAQWGVTEGGDKTAAGRPNPILSAVPGYSLTPSSGPTPWTPAVALDIPIETAGKRGYRIAQARKLSEAARLNIATAAWQVRSNLRTTLIDLAGARNRELLLQGQLSVEDRIVKFLEQRLQAGAVGISELGLVRIAQERVRFEWLDARRLSAEARTRVAEAIGVPVGALEGVDLSYDLSSFRPAAELLSPEVRRQALESRSEVLSALAEYAASQSLLQLEIARQYPDLHIGTGYQYDQANQKVALGLTVELPVLNQNQGPIAETEARREEFAARFNAVQAKVLSEIDRALVAYRATEEQLKALESLTAAQEKQSETVQAQAEAGEADPLDLLNARIELGLSELARLDGQLKLRLALGLLEDAMQRPIATLKASLIEQPQRRQVMKENQP